MADITLWFVGLTLLILVGLYLATRWLVPAVLAEEAHGEDPDSDDGSGHAT
jgi:hypothetical protein